MSKLCERKIWPPKLRYGNVVSFWSGARDLSSSTRRLPQSIDNVTGDTTIPELWKEKYSSVLNSVCDRTIIKAMVLKLFQVRSSSMFQLLYIIGWLI